MKINKKILISVVILIVSVLSGLLIAHFNSATPPKNSSKESTTKMDTYTSTIEFLAYVVDNQDTQSVKDENYVMEMLDTNIEMFRTNDFSQRLADELKEKTSITCTATTIKNALEIEAIKDTAMFKITVTTENADLSYEIAKQLETTIPEAMKESSNGLVSAVVVEKP